MATGSVFLVALKLGAVFGVVKLMGIGLEWFHSSDKKKVKESIDNDDNESESVSKRLSSLR
jgi:hypothetical protein